MRFSLKHHQTCLSISSGLPFFPFFLFLTILPSVIDSFSLSVWKMSQVTLSHFSP